jgi:hypothetical protein
MNVYFITLKEKKSGWTHEFTVIASSKKEALKEAENYALKWIGSTCKMKKVSCKSIKNKTILLYNGKS